MTRDAMTGGDWALCAFYLVALVVFTGWLIASARRELRDTADQIIAQAAAEVIAEAEHYTRQAS